MRSSALLLTLTAFLPYFNARMVMKSHAEIAELSAVAVDSLTFTKLANEFELLRPGKIQQPASLGAPMDSATWPGQNDITKISPLVISNNDVVTVEFTSSQPSSGDWIGAYSPPTVDITQTVPVKYGFLDASPEYLSTGRGALRFNMTNLRAPVKFYYFKNGLSAPQLVASSSAVVSFADNDEPLRPRVVPSGDPDVFRLLWSTAASASPTVKWGTARGDYSHVVAAASSSIAQTDMCGGDALGVGWRDLGLVHTASLSGMRALSGSTIYYIFGDAVTGTFSREFAFCVPPLAGTQPPSRPTTAVLLCDMGRGSSDDTYTWNEYGRPAYNTSNSVGALVAAGGVDVIVHGGDISYARGLSMHIHSPAFFCAFYVISPPSPNLPLPFLHPNPNPNPAQATRPFGTSGSTWSLPWPLARCI